MTAKAIAVAKPHDVAVVAPVSKSTAMLSMMERVLLDPNIPTDKLEALFRMQAQLEADEARKAFNVAFSDFKSEAVKIVKNTEIKDGPLKGKKHANLFDVVNAVTPHLSKHGLTISWKPTKDEPAWMEITCTLRHVGGHSESVSMGGGPDTGPGRNAIQARGSAKSYLERYTATAILGLAAQDADDDGKASGKAPKSEPIPGPKESKTAGPTKGTDTFTVKAPFLFGTGDKIEFRGPAEHQKYRINTTAAKTAKVNFKDGDTAEVAWEIKGGIKHVVDLDRKTSDASAF